MQEQHVCSLQNDRRLGSALLSLSQGEAILTPADQWFSTVATVCFLMVVHVCGWPVLTTRNSGDGVCSRSSLGTTILIQCQGRGGRGAHVGVCVGQACT